MSTVYDSAFSLLSRALLDLVEIHLTNDDISGDDEMADFFVECGLTPDQAKRAVQYRTLYLTHIYDIDSTPIRAGPQALFFDPHGVRYVTDPNYVPPPLE